MKKIKAVFLICLLLFSGFSLVLAQVSRPEELKFPPLKFEPPNPADYRVVLSNGLRAYVREERELPIINIVAIIHTGGLYVPKEKAGLDSLLSDCLIKGGTKTRSGPEIEERIDFLGGSLNFSVGERTASLSLSVLSKDLDEGLDIFFDVLMNPEFREDSLKLAKGRIIEQMRTANDNPSQILAREFEKVLYGEHPLTYQATKATVEGISQSDLKAFHSQYFFPKNIIIAAAGDFSRGQLRTKINRYASKWSNKSLSFPNISRNFPQPEPGVYFIQKKINQGYVSVGHLGIEDTNPDYFAVQVMNFILGGGSFTSRITSKVRSDEGLAYNTGSRFTYRWGFPGTFSGYVQTKSETVGYAISLILKEFERIRKEPVSEAEMETAINYYLESFADFFQSPIGTMVNFANLELQGKPMNYYATYRDKIRAVTKEKVMEVANKYIQPDKMVIMIVGDWEPCNKGSEKFPGPLDRLGKVHRVKLLDPLTGQLVE
ncbi:MAG: pitrilysin family protein [Acidobacteriota bacterium]|nr:pitrilysin family protein [Acidobacteriota bacterium]MDW3228452.1 pitrilysin family protein [Acidobacteriota bacterium]MDY0231434.1 pitrilysin family protein [Candidatus Saccharicenans sp.]